MVVVAILSVAAALLVPRFIRHRIQQRQAQCHENLRMLLDAEKNYVKKTGHPPSDLAEIGWRPAGHPWHSYRLLPNSPAVGDFQIECRGNIDRDPTEDIATIDESGKVTQISDDVRH